MRLGTPEQVEVLTALEPAVRGEIELHVERRRLWFPNDLMPADAADQDQRLAEEQQVRDAARGLPDEVRIALALNLLTEEGLPHFHRLIAVYFGPASPWSDWNNLWTAEEDRHGCVMRDYVRDARVFDMRAVEQMQFLYIKAGFEPEWQQDPYRLLAYTSLQEKATQISHANTGRMAAGIEPRLQRVLAHVAGDESRHYQFYRAVFGEILRADPERAIESLLKVTLNFAMPGHNIAGFSDMSEVLGRAGIFGTRHYRSIVEELLEYWQIGAMTGLSAHAQHNQERLMKIPARLSRMADYADAKLQRRRFSFDVIYGRSIEL
ncbi:acyl-ACP desaturase [Panacagrimonas sp.]|uniref:acyl-ACP desaturase n=1 Tax=Panacagrimonas sp. TaxID=2480088 RepID=UPI003B519570